MLLFWILTTIQIAREQQHGPGLLQLHRSTVVVIVVVVVVVVVVEVYIYSWVRLHWRVYIHNNCNS